MLLPGFVRANNEVTFWNGQALQAVRTTSLNPPRASRMLAMLHIAIFDAVNSIDQQPHDPYHFGTLADPACSKEAAVAQAAHDILVAIFPTQAADLAAALANRLSLIPDGAPKTEGLMLGATVADAILDLRANDGSNASPPPYMGGNGVGQWRPTLPAFAPGLLPFWGQVTPFCLVTSNQFNNVKPPPIGSPQYVVAVEEVRKIGGTTSTLRTADQTNIARFWADGAGTATPPGHWNRIMTGLVTSQGLTLSQTARMFALVNLGVADAGISCWELKYRFPLWRPITAIRENDNNPRTIQDPTWLPLIPTPPFPAYTSGHSTFSGAAATILAKFFGTDNIAFTTSAEGFAVPDRSFTSFSQAAREAMNSRLYGGIHYNFDNVDGLECGVAIGNYIYNHFLN